MPLKYQPSPEQRMQRYYDEYVSSRIESCLEFATGNNEKASIINLFLSATQNDKETTPEVFLKNLMALLNGLDSRKSSSTTINLDSKNSTEVFTYLFKLLSNSLSEKDLADDVKLMALQRAQKKAMSQVLIDINKFVQTSLTLKLAEFTDPELTTQYTASPS